MSTERLSSQAPLSYQRSLGALLKEGWFLYLKHGMLLTRPLVKPILWQSSGSLLAIILPCCLLAQINTIESAAQAGWDSLLLFLLAMPGIICFIKGFWDYLLYMASLNWAVVELLNSDPVSLKESFQQVKCRKKSYFEMLSLLLLIWLPSIGLMAGAVLLNSLWLQLTFGLLGIIVGLLTAIFTVYFSLAPQVFVFETSLGAFSSLKRSFRLLEPHFFKTLFLLVLLFIVTGIAVPGIITLGIDLTGISTQLGVLIHQINKGMMDIPIPFLTPVQVNAMIIDSFVGTMVNLALLPLGTIYFTMLYQDARARLA